MWGLTNWSMLVYLVIGAIWDFRKKEVPVWYLVIGTILALLFQGIYREETLGLILFGAVTGGAFLMLSYWSGQALGYGDSWMILILGIYLGVWKLFVVLGVAFLSASVVAGIGLSGKWLRRKSKLPFFPFLAVGYLGLYGW